LAEAVNNAGGLGLNGVDEKGRPKWDLLTNMKPFQLEKATSLKVVLDHWNIRKYIGHRIISIDFFSSINIETTLWLRRICYDRMKKGRTIGVFVLSALWVRRLFSQKFEY